jgi:hypothetical protein
MAGKLVPMTKKSLRSDTLPPAMSISDVMAKGASSSVIADMERPEARRTRRRGYDVVEWANDMPVEERWAVCFRVLAGDPQALSMGPECERAPVWPEPGANGQTTLTCSGCDATRSL